MWVGIRDCFGMAYGNFSILLCEAARNWCRGPEGAGRSYSRNPLESQCDIFCSGVSWPLLQFGAILNILSTSPLVFEPITLTWRTKKNRLDLTFWCSADPFRRRLRIWVTHASSRSAFPSSFFSRWTSPFPPCAYWAATAAFIGFLYSSCGRDANGAGVSNLSQRGVRHRGGEVIN